MSQAPPEDDRLLTPAELELMSILWEQGSGTVREVMSTLPENRTLAYTSVSTILRILEKKGFVSSTKEGRTHRYEPVVPRSDYEKTNLRTLVQRLFGGDPLSLVRCLVKADSLSEDDLLQMQKLVEEQLEDE